MYSYIHVISFIIFIATNIQSYKLDIDQFK